MANPNGTSLGTIRHGPTAWTEDKRIQGRADIPLSDEGRGMVSRWRLPPGHAAGNDDVQWVSSPLRRATETARLLGAAEPAIEPRLAEMDYGQWEGRRLSDLRRELGDAMAENEARGLDFRPLGGESPREVMDRLRPWLADVGRRRRPTLAVTHHGVIRALLSLATGWPMTGRPPDRLAWGAIHYFLIGDDGGVAVDRLNVSLEPE